MKNGYKNICQIMLRAAPKCCTKCIAQKFSILKYQSAIARYVHTAIIFPWNSYKNVFANVIMFPCRYTLNSRIIIRGSISVSVSSIHDIYCESNKVSGYSPQNSGLIGWVEYQATAATNHVRSF